MSLGRAIRKLRLQRDWTLGQLSAYSRVAKSYLSRIERDKHENVSAKVVAKIAQAFDVSVDYLLTEAGLLPASDNTALAPEVAHLDAIIRAFPPGPLRAQAEEIIVQIGLALAHTLDQTKLDEIMQEQEQSEEKEG